VTLQRLNLQQFEKFRDLIYQRCGIRIDSNKMTLLSNRIRRRLRACEMDDFDQYFRYLTSPRGAGEIEGFLDAITTNETFFFRTASQFDWFKSEWLSDQVRQQRAGRRPKTLRIWSAGCASGAEPYSLAILLAENRFRLADWSVSVLGTDISHEMLDAARKAAYPPRALEAVTPRQLRCYFDRDKDSDRWIIKPAIRDMVHFEHHNLMRPLRQPAFDLIFIRNVLIYFDQESKLKVVRHLIGLLADGGHLVIGPSEGIAGLLGELEKVSALVFRKRTAAGAGGQLARDWEVRR